MKAGMPRNSRLPELGEMMMPEVGYDKTASRLRVQVSTALLCCRISAEDHLATIQVDLLGLSGYLNRCERVLRRSAAKFLQTKRFGKYFSATLAFQHHENLALLQH